MSASVRFSAAAAIQQTRDDEARSRFLSRNPERMRNENENDEIRRMPLFAAVALG
jgi:hypothetical protein